MHTVENGKNEWMTPSPSVTMTLPWGRAGLRARRTVWVQAWPRYKIISKKLLTLIDCFKIRGNLWGRSIIMCPYMQLFITLILPAYYFLPCEFLSFIKRASDHGTACVKSWLRSPLETWSSLSRRVHDDWFQIFGLGQFIRDHNDS